MRKLLSVFVVFAVLSFSLHAQDKNWKNALEQKLAQTYTLAEYDGFRNAVKKPGVGLIVQTTGILSHDQSMPFGITAKVRNGVIKDPQSYACEGDYLLKVGDKVYVREIAVGDSNIEFHLITSTPIERLVNGTARSNTFTAKVSFEFEKGFLNTASVGDIARSVRTILLTENEVASSNTKTIELGQTIEQVEKILGKPMTVAKLGSKTIYTYKDMKVIFTDGKVTDVQ